MCRGQGQNLGKVEELCVRHASAVHAQIAFYMGLVTSRTPQTLALNPFTY